MAGQPRGGRGRAATRARATPRARQSSSDDPDLALRTAVEGLSRVAEAFERRRQQLARDLGLSDAQLRALEDIARDDFMPSLFARRRACTAAAVSRTLRQLQEAGLATSAIGESDGRQRAYSLTSAGRRVVDRLRARRLKAVDAIWRDLPAHELTRFGKFSAELADRLDAYAEQSARDT
jgi:DNA-binding MarR family transcriptional regulator